MKKETFLMQQIFQIPIHCKISSEITMTITTLLDSNLRICDDDFAMLLFKLFDFLFD